MSCVEAQEDPILLHSFNSGADTYREMYHWLGFNLWYGQTFNTSAYSETIYSVKVSIKYTLAPMAWDNVRLSIYPTENGSCYIPIDVSEELTFKLLYSEDIPFPNYNWTEFVLPEVTLNASTRYVITIHTQDNSYPTALRWEINTTDGLNGQKTIYKDWQYPASEWTQTSGQAFMFEVWGWSEEEEEEESEFWLPLMFIVGMIGLCCMVGGPIYGYFKIKSHEYYSGARNGFLFTIIGASLMMAWLWT